MSLLRCNILLGVAFFYFLAAQSINNPSYAKTNNEISIIEAESYHGVEVIDAQDGEEWSAFTVEDGKTLVKNVRISVKTIFDEVTDNEGDSPTGKYISSSPKYNNILFMVKGIKLKDGRIPTYHTVNSPIKGGDRLTVKGDKSSIELIEKNDINTKTYDGRDVNNGYQLTLKINDKEIKLSEVMLLDDNYPKLIWSGDINNDGYPDLVIDTSYHYNMERITLFLSRNKNGKINYKKVAEHTSYGC
ncbi:MAG: hypothetical protein R3D71_04165 [Rickettsiales bacterium]